MKQDIRQRLESLRGALNYVDPSGRYVGQYRLRGSSRPWKILRIKAQLINLAKYEYRTSQATVWLEYGTDLVTSAGRITIRLARRLLAIADKRMAFRLGGFDIRVRNGGRITVGCTTFDRADVKLARQLVTPASK